MFGVPNCCHRQRGSVIGVVPWVELVGWRTLKNTFFSLFFRQSRQKSKNTKKYFFFYPCLRHFYRYVMILNDTTMLERVILGCVKVFTGKKGFSLFTTILVKIAQGHSTLAFTTYYKYKYININLYINRIRDTLLFFGKVRIHEGLLCIWLIIFLFTRLFSFLGWAFPFIILPLVRYFVNFAVVLPLIIILLFLLEILISNKNRDLFFRRFRLNLIFVDFESKQDHSVVI